MKAGRPRPHLLRFDERGEKAFRIVRAADRTAEQNPGSISDGFWIQAGGAEGTARGEPGEPVTAGAVKRGAEGCEVSGDFPDRNLAVPRRLKQREWAEAALSGLHEGPDFIHAIAGGGDDAQAGDDWEAI